MGSAQIRREVALVRVATRSPQVRAAHPQVALPGRERDVGDVEADDLPDSAVPEPGMQIVEIDDQGSRLLGEVLEQQISGGPV